MQAILLALVIASAQAPSDSVLLKAAVRDPSPSATGRLAFELNGDVWVAKMGTADLGLATQITSGPAWDRGPAWTPDGTSVIFSSDRRGNFDLWSVSISEDGVASEPKAITDAPESEHQPAISIDGSIAFVRGDDGTADLWIRHTDGRLERLTRDVGAEVSPTWSPDGRRIAYVAVRGGRRELRVHSIPGDSSVRVATSVAVEYPAWSPTGEVIAFGSRGRQGGVWITSLDARYTNLVSTHAAKPAWTHDGAWLVLAELPPRPPGYNGDPDRLGDRVAGDILPSAGRLWMTPAPTLPDGNAHEVTVAATVDRASYNAEAFDRVWSRVNRLYYSTEQRSAWEAARRRYRTLALSAISDSALEDAVFQFLSRRPSARREVTGRAGVSSAHPLATAAGVEVLRQGGNVVDAAVAVSFVLGVVEPDASGIGGYGEMVLYLQGMSEPVVIEFLTRVPEAASLDNAALLRGGSLPSDGPVLANVPGTVAGMRRAWEEYGSGKIPWASLLQPAITIAQTGFVLDEAFPTTLRREQGRFLQYEGSRALFFPDGRALQSGDTLRNPDLARTLEQIAEHGAEAFYKGAIARRMVQDLRAHRNAMTETDVARYFAVERAPVRGVYRDHTVYGAAPAASGGVALVSKLHLLAQFTTPMLYRDDAATTHAMIEAWKLAPSTAGRVADPSLWPVNLTPFVDRDSARIRWQRCFDPARATGADALDRRGDSGLRCVDSAVVSLRDQQLDCDQVHELGAAEQPCRATGTTAFAIADAEGNMVSTTQTLGTWGGNFYVTPGLGFLYNDKLRSYRTDPTAYGARLPYARHGTSIAPTLVFEGIGDTLRPKLAVGAAGNAWITAAVYQVVAATIDGGIGPQEALELPRFLVGVQRFEGRVQDVIVQIEDAFAPSVMRRLRALGHTVRPISLKGELRMGYGAAVLVEDGRVRAGADPRRSGAAGATNNHNQ